MVHNNTNMDVYQTVLVVPSIMANEPFWSNGPKPPPWDCSNKCSLACRCSLDDEHSGIPCVLHRWTMAASADWLWAGRLLWNAIMASNFLALLDARSMAACKLHGQIQNHAGWCVGIHLVTAFCLGNADMVAKTNGTSKPKNLTYKPITLYIKSYINYIYILKPYLSIYLLFCLTDCFRDKPAYIYIYMFVNSNIHDVLWLCWCSWFSYTHADILGLISRLPKGTWPYGQFQKRPCLSPYIYIYRSKHIFVYLCMCIYTGKYIYIHTYIEPWKRQTLKPTSLKAKPSI